MVTAQLLKWQAPVEMKLTASDLESMAIFFTKPEIEEILKDSYAMKTIAKQIVAQSEKVQDALNPSYNS
jgi:glutamine amidotransferase PdxT